MKITVFTSNQARHLSLIEDLSVVAKEVFVIQECNTIFPGEVEDFYKRSEIMKTYFSHVIQAEKAIFGSPRFLPSNVRSISMKDGDLNRLEMSILEPALRSDYYIVFGSSYIKGPLIDFLVAHRAINIHMGISPYYRGNSCNFWALHDRKPEYVGATIHLLSKGLDSGLMLFHAVPKEEEIAPFLLGMRAVRAAHQGLLSALKAGDLLRRQGVLQNKDLEIRYTRNRDFNDEVAARYLSNQPTKQEIYRALKHRDLNCLVNPFVY